LTGDHHTLVRYPCTRRHISGRQCRRRQQARYFWVPLALLTAIVLTHPTTAAPTKEIRRILILNEVNSTYPGISIINQGIQAGLNDSPYHLDFYAEYMDTSLFPDPAVQQEFRDSYIRKYQNRKLDVIIAVGPSPLRFMQAVHQRAFPGVPIVFCLPTLGAPGTPIVDPDFTGVENDIAPAETVGTALRLLPGTKNVIVVGGVAPIDREQLANVKDELRGYEGRVDISYVTDLAMPDLLDHLKHLPSNTVVLLTSLGRDAAGTGFRSNELGPMVVGAANAPIFSLYDVYLNHGEVGGYLSSLSEQGKVAGGMALRILKGAKPRDIPEVKGVNAYMIDWRALKRWGMNEKNLPPGSIVLNREPSFWELYKQYAVAAIFLISLQFAAILGLLWQRARRRKTEAQLIRAEEKFSKSFRQSPLAISIASMKDGRYIDVNEAFEQQTGWCRDEVIGRSPSDIAVWVDPDQRSLFIKQLLAEGTVRDVEVSLRRKDGQIRTTLGSAELIEINGKPCALSVLADITERKLAEAALENVSRKLIEAQEQERTRIGRELHDDIGQRLAMLAIAVEQLQEESLALPAEVRNHVGELQKQTSEIAADIQSLSHELHTSKLEYLGIAAAMRGFCREFGEQHKVEVDFKSHDLPSPLSADISLCLFRVLQEALHNSTKHSGVRHFEVRLWGTSDATHLTVVDSGIGFDREAAKTSQGLGLVSMEERLKLVKGTLSIESQPQRGTTIRARVPLSTGSDFMRAAG
jgi:PAS domain S-box-containing protein